MRIAIDARAASHPQRGGFKTYTEGLIKGLASTDSGTEYILYTDRLAPFEFELPCNFKMTLVPGQPQLVGAGFREQVRLPWQLRCDGVDLAHFPCNTGPVLYKGKFVVTLHDLIPIAHSPWLPTGLSLRDIYQSILRLYARLLIPQVARGAQAVITDSSASREELVRILNLPRGKVCVIPLAQSERFRHVDGQMAMQAVGKQFGVRGPYILSIGSAEPRKNIKATLEAYSQLPPALRQQYSLVIVLSHGALRQRFERLVIDRGLSGRVTFLERPPDLLYLYNAAQLFVFPSLYEGFGIPVLEAMACGVPVITSDCTSLPEISGEAALLVNPEDVREIKMAIEAVLVKPELQNELRKKGLLRAAEFTWERTARETLDVYRWVMH